MLAVIFYCLLLNFQVNLLSRISDLQDLQDLQDPQDLQRLLSRMWREENLIVFGGHDGSRQCWFVVGDASRDFLLASRMFANAKTMTLRS